MKTSEIEDREPDPDIDGCPECGHDDYKEVNGEYVCAVCGAFYGEES